MGRTVLTALSRARTGCVPTPVGPVPPDPDDPDLWDEWYQPDDDEVATPRFGWPVRLLAVLITVALVLLLIVAG